MPSGSSPTPAPPDAAEAVLAAWRRNLVALTAAVFIGFTGFTLVMPFLPIYIGQMGVTDPGVIAAWTGVTLGVTPAMTALFSPLWGRLADRFGRRFMVARSLVSFVFIMGAMAFVTQPWHLFALRVLQGFFAGYGALALAMAAESAPPGRLAQSIGLVQTGGRLGPALGPVIGGLVAGVVGLRATFFVAAAFYGIAFVLVLTMYTEPASPPRTAASADSGGQVTFRSVMAFENFLLLMAVIFGLQFVDRSFGPVLPLMIAETGMGARDAALSSGIIFSVIACSAALGHHYCARLLKRWSSRLVISRAAVVAAAATVGMAVSSGTWWLGLSAFVFGVSIGAAMTAAYTAAANNFPDNLRATGFGFLTSASLVGLAVSPMVAGALAGVGIRTIFVVNVVILVVLGAVVRRTMEEAATETTAPAVEDA